MPRLKYPAGFEHAILDLIRENGGTLTVDWESDYTVEFLSLLEQMADAGTIEVDDYGEAGRQTFRLPGHRGQVAR